MKDSNYLPLRNHGLLTTGPLGGRGLHPHVLSEPGVRNPVQTLSMGQKVTVPSPEVCTHAAKQHDDYAYLDTARQDREWTASLRLQDRDGGDYRC